VRGDLGPEVGRLLGDGTSNAGALHLTLGVHNDASVVLEVQNGAVLAAPALALTDDHCVQHLLAELRLALLHRAHHHIAEGGGRKTIEPSVVALDGDDVQVLGASVVSAVHDGTHGESDGHAEAAALNVSLILTHFKNNPTSK